MRKFFAIVWREIGVYFVSPMAYLVLTAFLFVIGAIHYYSMVVSARQLQPFQYRTTLEFISLFIILICPLITSRLIAEEKKSGTLEILFTTPIREFQFVMAKYVAAMIFVCYLLAFTLWFVFLSRRTAIVDLQSTMVGYLGLVLVSGSVVSVGLFISTVCPNQVVAGILTLAVSLMFMLMHVISQGFKLLSQDSTVAKVLYNLGLISNTYSLFNGIIDTRNIVYLISFTAFFLFLSVRFLTVRRLI